MPQSYSLHYISFPHTEVELGLPTGSSSLAPACAPPASACVLTSYVLASHNVSGYIYSDPEFIKEPESAASWTKKLLPKLVEKWKAAKGKGRLNTLLSKKSHGCISERQQLESSALRTIEEYDEWQSSEDDDDDSGSSWSNSSHEESDGDHMAVWLNSPDSMGGEFTGEALTGTDGRRLHRLY